MNRQVLRVPLQRDILLRQLGCWLPLVLEIYMLAGCRVSYSGLRAFSISWQPREAAVDVDTTVVVEVVVVTVSEGRWRVEQDDPEWPRAEGARWS